MVFDNNPLGFKTSNILRNMNKRVGLEVNIKTLIFFAFDVNKLLN